MQMRCFVSATLLLALAGCQAAGQPYAAPGFAIGRLGTAAVVAPVAVPVAIGPQVSGDAALTVDVRSALPAARRHLLAVLADVAKVTVRVQGTGIDQTLELTKAQLDAGTTSVTFTDLPAGPYTVTVRALDAASVVIGSDIRQASVTAGQTTTVAATIKLDPTIATPRTLPSPTAGGSSTATGSLTTTVTLRDDLPVYTPTVLGTYAGPGTMSQGGAHVVADAEGHAWATWGSRQIARISPAGQVVVQTGLPEYVIDVARSADGQRIYLGGASRLYTTLTGTLGPTVTGGPLLLYEKSAVAPDGTYYVGSYAAPMKQILADGSSRTFVARNVSEFATDAAGDVWTAELVLPAVAPQGTVPTGVTITKQGADNAVRFTRTLDYTGTPTLLGYHSVDLELDAAGNAWVAMPGIGRLVRLKPDGEPLDVKPFPSRGRLYADPQGRMWLNQWGNVGRFDAAGELTGWYHVASNLQDAEIAITADDRLWVAAWTYGVIQLQLDLN